MVQKFEYRQPRFAINHAVQAVFRTERAGSIEGACEDLSVDGAGVRFGEPIPIGTKGILSLSAEGSSLEVKARVAHLDQERCGIVFDSVTDEQREEIQNLINISLQG